jgi:hypothetical protein
MINSKLYIYSFVKVLIPLLLGGLVFEECQTEGEDLVTSISNCNTVTDIEGVYNCTGECIIIGDDGKKELIIVTGETDRITRYPNSKTNLYQNKITSSNNFHEIELGALEGLTLRTATAEVSDRQFPVLEEYIFKTDGSCKAIGFTKIVRNPNPALFKTCYIYCKKAP